MTPDHHPFAGASDSADTEPSPAGEGDSPDGSDRRSAAPARARRLNFSLVLSLIAADRVRNAVAVNALITFLGGRGRVGLILLFALPIVQPAPPGMPLLDLSSQKMPGRVPFVSGVIGHRSVARGRVARLVDSAAPLLAGAGRLLRALWVWLGAHRAECMIGAICLVPAAVLALAIPLGNMLPAPVLSPNALGVRESDSLWVLIGTLTGLASLVAGGVYARIKSTLFCFSNACG